MIGQTVITCINGQSLSVKLFVILCTLTVCRYASTVMEVYKVNEELNSQLREVSQFTAQFSAEAGKKYN